MRNHSNTKSVWMTICAVCTLLSAGCVAQQSDLKQTERNLQQRIKQSNDESAQTRARQSQEILMLREQELPQLRGELERAFHQAQEHKAKQEERLDSLDVVIGKILLRMEDLEKRLQTLKKPAQ